MPDKKLTELPEITSLSDDDIFYLVNDPTSSDASSKVTWANIKKSSYGLATVSNQDYNILSSDLVVFQIATLTASRTFTLPLASSVPPGYGIIIADKSGTVSGSNSIIINTSGSNTLSTGGNSIALTSNKIIMAFYSDGTGMWVTSSGLGLLAANNLNDVASIPSARNNLGVDTISRVKLAYTGWL